MYYLKRYFRFLPALAFLFTAVLMPYLHMGGFVCPHHGHGSESGRFSNACETGFRTFIYEACEDVPEEDADCTVCSFLATYSAVSGIICTSLFTHYANFTFASHGVEIDAAKSIDLSNPPTAPPFSI